MNIVYLYFQDYKKKNDKVSILGIQYYYKSEICKLNK